MSLIGIDLGTSAIKVAAYSVDGTVLAQARSVVPAHRPQPGQWEVDVSDSRIAFQSALQSVATDPLVVRDPPIAISFSSSGREVFPAGDDGSPLGVCLMTADIRGGDRAGKTAAIRRREEWFDSAGHVPRRMDPVNRALWWQETQPEVTAKARWFMNWHDYYSLLLSGRPVVDSSNAGAWATYDLGAGGWSAELVNETGLNRRWLPEVQAPATPIGPVLAASAREFSLPPNTLIVTGAWDIFAAAVGAGSLEPGIIALNCGSWHTFTMPVRAGWPAELVHDGVDVFPHPGPTGFGLAVFNPNGMSIIDWARNIFHLSIQELDQDLVLCNQAPGSVFANAAFTPLPHGGSGDGGLLSNLTLSTTGPDIVRALFEAIAGDFSLAVERLRQRGIETNLVRASGGGAKSSWLMQLHADVSGLPVEVTTHDEPGTFGAAILAGVGAGIYPSVSAAVTHLVRMSRRFDPDPSRGALYAGVRERLAFYQNSPNEQDR